MPLPFQAIATTPSSGRRHLLGGLLAVYIASLFPSVLAEPPSAPSITAFLSLSAILVGRDDLDRALAKRLYLALNADDAGFAAGVVALLALIQRRGIEPAQLQSLLDTEHANLAHLPRAIASAWFLGIVGSAEKARCLAFENALNAQVVADVLKPATYCYGVYGSWVRKPTGGASA